MVGEPGGRPGGPLGYTRPRVGRADDIGDGGEYSILSGVYVSPIRSPDVRFDSTPRVTSTVDDRRKTGSPVPGRSGKTNSRRVASRCRAR